MLIIAVSAILIFWLRDYMSLRMSPCNKAPRRALFYGAAVLLTAVLAQAMAAIFGLTGYPRLIQSPPVLFSLIAFHFAATTLSFWIRKTQAYNWMWVTALVPAPIVWFFLLEAAALMQGELMVLIAVALLWAASMIVVVFRLRHIQMPMADLDFAVLFGSLSHFIAVSLLPLALVME